MKKTKEKGHIEEGENGQRTSTLLKFMKKQ